MPSIYTKNTYGGPSACGNVQMNSGYACGLRNLILGWRNMWDEPDLPFAIINIAGGTSEVKIIYNF